MASFVGNAPYQLRQKYESLVAELDNVATSSDCGAVNGVVRFDQYQPGKYNVEGHLYLANWKDRASKGRLHILVHVQEEIRREGEEYLLDKSTVRVGYFHLDEERAQLLHSVHYDHGASQVSHPIFHAQVTNEPVSLGVHAQELGFEFEQVPCMKTHGNGRIPTSDMTLPSVLLCLAADHVSTDIFPDFLSTVRALQKNLPHPVLGKLQISVQAEKNHLRSSHWFAHTDGY